MYRGSGARLKEKYCHVPRFLRCPWWQQESLQLLDLSFLLPNPPATSHIHFVVRRTAEIGGWVCHVFPFLLPQHLTLFFLFLLVSQWLCRRILWDDWPQIVCGQKLSESMSFWRPTIWCGCWSGPFPRKHRKIEKRLFDAKTRNMLTTLPFETYRSWLVKSIVAWRWTSTSISPWPKVAGFFVPTWLGLIWWSLMVQVLVSKSK